GRLWVSTLEGVAYFESGRFTRVRQLPAGRMASIAGDSAGNLWIVNEVHGLYRLHGTTVVEHTSWNDLGLRNSATVLLVEPGTGGLGLGLKDQVAYVRDGAIRASFGAADGLADGRVNDLRFDRDGALWVAMETGLSRVKDGRLVTISRGNGLPCDAVHWSMER